MLLEGDIGACAFLEGLSAVDLVASLLPLLQLPEVVRGEMLSAAVVSCESTLSVFGSPAVANIVE